MTIFIMGYYQYSLCDCKERVTYQYVNTNDHLEPDSLFKAVDSVDLSQIRQSWKAFDPSYDRYGIVDSVTYFSKRPLLIVEQTTAGRRHYGAVFLPQSHDGHKKYPVLLWAPGLDQANPAVHVSNGVLQRIARNLPGYFIVIPSFRGQALVLGEERYCSDGFFGDAFDGATDDALRLLHLVKTEFEGVDNEDLSVGGLSRGGTVALLMASRDHSIARTVSIAGPVDLYGRKFLERYSLQYKYQFLSQARPIKEIRDKILMSSPTYFISTYYRDLLVIHGEKDQVVSVEDIQKMGDKLSSKPHFTLEIHGGGHDFYDWDRVTDWIKGKSSY